MLREEKVQLFFFIATNDLQHDYNIYHQQTFKGQKNDRSVNNPHLYTKTKIFFSSKINISVQNAERSASAGISYSQLQIQIMLQIMSSIMRIFPIISWSKVKKTTEVFIIFICRHKKVSSQ